MRRLGDKPAVGKAFRKKTGRRLEKFNVERGGSRHGRAVLAANPPAFSFVERNLIASASRKEIGKLRRRKMRAGA